MPSIKEGFGTAAVEAQLSGVFVFASNRLPTDTDLGLIEYLPLEQGATEWAKHIDSFIQANHRSSKHIRNDNLEKYDFQYVAQLIKTIYFSSQ